MNHENLGPICGSEVSKAFGQLRPRCSTLSAASPYANSQDNHRIPNVQNGVQGTLSATSMVPPTSALDKAGAAAASRTSRSSCSRSSCSSCSRRRRSRRSRTRWGGGGSGSDSATRRRRRSRAGCGSGTRYLISSREPTGRPVLPGPAVNFQDHVWPTRFVHVAQRSATSRKLEVV